MVEIHLPFFNHLKLLHPISLICPISPKSPHMFLWAALFSSKLGVGWLTREKNIWEVTLWSEGRCSGGAHTSDGWCSSERETWETSTFWSEIVLQVGPTALMAPISIQRWGCQPTFYPCIKMNVDIKASLYQRPFISLKWTKLPLYLFFFVPLVSFSTGKRPSKQFLFFFFLPFFVSPWIVGTLPHECGTFLHVILENFQQWSLAHWHCDIRS